MHAIQSTELFARLVWLIAWSIVFKYIQAYHRPYMQILRNTEMQVCPYHSIKFRQSHVMVRFYDLRTIPVT